MSKTTFDESIKKAAGKFSTVAGIKDITDEQGLRKLLSDPTKPTNETLKFIIEIFNQAKTDKTQPSVETFTEIVAFKSHILNSNANQRLKTELENVIEDTKSELNNIVASKDLNLTL